MVSDITMVRGLVEIIDPIGPIDLINNLENRKFQRQRRGLIPA
jgi:hypothetical protein